MHIVAEVNHRGLGVKVETNCLRDLIPRHSFLSTSFSIFINGVLKFMCVSVFHTCHKLWTDILDCRPDGHTLPH